MDSVVMKITADVARTLFQYDPQSGIITWRVKRRRVNPGDEAGCVVHSHGKPYRSINTYGRGYMSHHIAFLLTTGAFPDRELDHIDGNGLNNKWHNLREVEHVENQHNRRRGSNNTSGHVGVVWHKRDKTWHVFVNVQKRQIFVGCFRDLTDAVAARHIASSEHGYHKNHGSDRPL